MTVPLCVDLDGTLVRSNVLVETLVGTLKHRPLLVFALPVWLARGRATLKRELAARADIDVARLPYDEALLADLRRERLAGRPIYLATAADEAIARRIADHLGLFDGVVASNGRDNLKGELDWMKELRTGGALKVHVVNHAPPESPKAPGGKPYASK